MLSNNEIELQALLAELESAKLENEERVRNGCALAYPNYDVIVSDIRKLKTEEEELSVVKQQLSDAQQKLDAATKMRAAESVPKDGTRFNGVFEFPSGHKIVTEHGWDCFDDQMGHCNIDDGMALQGSRLIGWYPLPEAK